jgi:hypothetical protein
MDTRAQAAARRLMRLVVDLALRFNRESLPLIGEPLRLSCFTSADPNIDQQSDTEKPHPGDFLHGNRKFPRTSERRSSPCR